MKILAKFLIFSMMIFCGATYAEEVAPYADKYIVLDNPQPTSTEEEGKIEVVEVFSYMCPHCFHFNNFLQEWLKTKAQDVEFVHLPVVFGKEGWEPLSKAYFTAKNLGVLDKVHNPIFDSIHKENKLLNNEKSLAHLFAKYGVEEKAFSEMYNSFSVDTQVRSANTQASKYGVSGVPTLVVNGKYRVSSGMSGGYKEMMQVVDYLVEKERTSMTTHTDKKESKESDDTGKEGKKENH